MKKLLLAALVSALLLLVHVSPAQAQRGRFLPRPYPPYPYYPYPYFFPFPLFNNNPPQPPNYEVTPQSPVDQLPAPKENRAVIHIIVPSTANDIWVDGIKMPTRETSSRVFISPPLEPGHTYTYTIRAAWPTGLSMVTQERTVALTANRTVTVDFNQPSDY